MSKFKLYIIILKFLYSYLGLIHLTGHFSEKQVKERNTNYSKNCKLAEFYDERFGYFYVAYLIKRDILYILLRGLWTHGLLRHHALMSQRGRWFRPLYMYLFYAKLNPLEVFRKLWEYVFI